MRIKQPQEQKPELGKPIIKTIKPLIFPRKCKCCNDLITREEMWEINYVPPAKPANVAYYIDCICKRCVPTEKEVTDRYNKFALPPKRE